MEFAWAVLSRILYETSTNCVIASVYAFPSAQHFAIGRRHERAFWGAHAKIEGIYFGRPCRGFSTWKSASPPKMNSTLLVETEILRSRGAIL